MWNMFSLLRFRSPLLSQSMFLSFPPGTEMVHFPGFARARLWIHRAVRRVYLRGFPHSEIPGSKPACGSPRLIAACHVLHRLLLPRHPPCALSSLTIKLTRHTVAPALTLDSHPEFLQNCHPERNNMLEKHVAKPRDLHFCKPPRLPQSPPHAVKILWALNSCSSRVRRSHASRPSSVFTLGTHKNLQPCRLPNLFSYQTSSSSA